MIIKFGKRKSINTYSKTKAFPPHHTNFKSLIHTFLFYRTKFDSKKCIIIQVRHAERESQGENRES